MRRACSQGTAIIWVHHGPTWCESARYAEISLCCHFFAPAWSRISNHSAQTFPVLAFTAASLIRFCVRGFFIAAAPRSSFNLWSSYNRKMEIQSKMAQLATGTEIHACEEIVQTPRSGTRLFASFAGGQARHQGGPANFGYGRRKRGIIGRALQSRAGLFARQTSKRCGPNFLFFRSETRSDAAEIAGRLDPAEWRDLGGVSQRPETHP